MSSAVGLWHASSPRISPAVSPGASRTLKRGELDAVQERVQRGSTALDPARETVATRALVVGRIESLRRATFDHLSLDAGTRQRGRP